jgi:hypothetical protein
VLQGGGAGAGGGFGGQNGGVLAQNPELFLGEDLLAWLVLAFGGALVVGNVAALLRPPTHLRDGSEPGGRPGKAKTAGSTGAAHPPVGRAVAMIIVGLVAAIWGLASLVGG